MTQALENAFAKLSELPVVQQDAFAQWILAELESEQRWVKSFADSQDILAMLADKALKDFREGKTHELDVYTLSEYDRLISHL